MQYILHATVPYGLISVDRSTQHPASAFKARGTPHAMRLHEIMGIEANRRWGTCTLNEFRKASIQISLEVICVFTSFPAA